MATWIVFLCGSPHLNSKTIMCDNKYWLLYRASSMVHIFHTLSERLPKLKIKNEREIAKQYQCHLIIYPFK